MMLARYKFPKDTYATKKKMILLLFLEMIFIVVFQKFESFFRSLLINQYHLAEIEVAKFQKEKFTLGDFVEVCHLYKREVSFIDS